jgi:hypothetical protein
MLNIPLEKNAGFSIQAFKNIIEITGTIASPEAEQRIKAFFEQANAMILSQEIKEVRVDVKNVSFINSSGIKEFAVWVLKQKELPSENKYAIVFQCNPNAEWQKQNFSVMQHLNPDCVKLEN